MKSAVPNALRAQLTKLRGRIYPTSLQGQLTVGIGLLFALSLGSVALWTCWKMKKLLVTSHQESVFTVTNQITEDVTFYSEMLPMEKSLQKAMDNRSAHNLLLWVDGAEQSLVAVSPKVTVPAWRRVGHPKELAPVFLKGLPLDLYQIRDRNFIAYHSPLIVGNQNLGTLFVAQDITQEQQRINYNIQTLVLATGLAMVLSLLAIAWFVRRSLKPLCQIQLQTQAISVEDLGQAQVKLNAAPKEIQALANTFNMMLARLSEAWTQQHQSIERQRQFVSNVSHELRTPLTIVRGYLQSLLRRSDNLQGHQREALEVASQEADQTIQLLQDLLNLARAEDGYMAYDLQVLILNDVVADVVQMAEQFSHRTILVEASTSLIPIYADPNRLQQVIANLVDNALKFSEDVVKIKLEQAEDRAVIQVCDRGPGIPRQQQVCIFDRFYRLDEARTRSQGGTGLGLSIVKTFVEGMGGQVTVLSELNEGSTFTVTLPISPTSP